VDYLGVLSPMRDFAKKWGYSFADNGLNPRTLAFRLLSNINWNRNILFKGLHAFLIAKYKIKQFPHSSSWILGCIVWVLKKIPLKSIATLKGNDNVKVKVFYLILPSDDALSTVTSPFRKYGCSINYHQI
jgi:hypothetical protein